MSAYNAAPDWWTRPGMQGALVSAEMPVDFTVPPVSDAVVWGYLSDIGLADALQDVLGKLDERERLTACEQAGKIRDLALAVLLSPDRPVAYLEARAQLALDGRAATLPGEYGSEAIGSCR